MTQMITSFTGEHRFLSNFDISTTGFAVMSLGHGGVFCQCAEHAFQAHKAAQDPALELAILSAPTPGEAKKLGRRAVLPPWWEFRKKQIMLEILLAKFSLPDYHAALLATGDAVLVEGNTWGDHYWGAVPAAHAMIRTTGEPRIWQAGGYASEWLAGDNWLGRLLMMVREVLG